MGVGRDGGLLCSGLAYLGVIVQHSFIGCRVFWVTTGFEGGAGVRWSQLKRRIEGGFALRVRGRVEVGLTRYRHSPHQLGEAWVTFDKRKAVTMAAIRFENAQYEIAQRVRKERDHLDQPYPDVAEWAEASRQLHDSGVFHSDEFTGPIFSYLNLSIDGALSSESAVVRAFAMLDRRLGKRRLAGIDVTNENVLVGEFHRFRSAVEGLDDLPLGRLGVPSFLRR